MAGYIPNWEQQPAPAPRPPRPAPPPPRPSPRPRPIGGPGSGETKYYRSDTMGFALAAIGTVLLGFLSDYLVGQRNSVLWFLGIIGCIATFLGGLFSVFGCLYCTRMVILRWMEGIAEHKRVRIFSIWEFITFSFTVAIACWCIWAAFFKESKAERRERIKREWAANQKPLPQSGTMKVSADGPRTVRLRIEASYRNCLVKLVYAGTDREAVSVFVRRDQPATVNVPPGKFEFRYASGEVWYGYDKLFGPETEYNRSSSPHELEPNGSYTWSMTKRPHGNFKTTTMRGVDF